MSEPPDDARGTGPSAADPGSADPGSAALLAALGLLRSQDPGALPGRVALERLRTVLRVQECLAAVALTGVLDLDRRELFTLDACGTARGWLRTQPGGEHGQVRLARRLATHVPVAVALQAGAVSLRAAEQLCTALELLPDQLHPELTRALLVDGVGDLLRQAGGGLNPEHSDFGAQQARQQADLALLEACAADAVGDPDPAGVLLDPPLGPGAGPAERCAPAFVLLADRLAPAHLGPALAQLLDALRPDGCELDSDTEAYFLTVTPVLHGDWEIRGLLSPETGALLSARLEELRSLLGLDKPQIPTARRPRTLQPLPKPASPLDPDDPWLQNDDAAPDSAGRDSAEPGVQDAGVDAAPAAGPGPYRPPTWDDEPDEGADAVHTDGAAAADPAECSPDRPPQEPPRLLPVSQQRHDALTQLLRDSAEHHHGTAHPPPVRLTITASLAAIEGRDGALPGLLDHASTPTPVSARTLQRLGCWSELTAVLLDAAGNPVGASGTHRSATPKERRALRAQWGHTCAVAGCHRTATVPHHVEPWWKTSRTRLRDLAPICTSCHHDLHEGHRTLRLRDGRLLNDQGWVTAYSAA